MRGGDGQEPAGPQQTIGAQRGVDERSRLVRRLQQPHVGQGGDAVVGEQLQVRADRFDFLFHRAVRESARVPARNEFQAVRGEHLAQRRRFARKLVAQFEALVADGLAFGETVPYTLENRPQDLALFTANAGLATEPGDIAVVLPTRSCQASTTSKDFPDGPADGKAHIVVGFTELGRFLRVVVQAADRRDDPHRAVDSLRNDTRALREIADPPFVLQRLAFDGGHFGRRESLIILIATSNEFGARLHAVSLANPAAQRQIDRVWEDQKNWRKMAIHNIANVGWFSSDRTIAEYAKEIWGVL